MLRFGTDGVRGDAETQLGSKFVVALGRAAARVVAGSEPFLIGCDTRISSDRIAHDSAVGCWIERRGASLIGVLPTPGVAYASQQLRRPAAVISASHNPWADNGIKLFAAGGVKLDDFTQSAIEEELARLLLVDDTNPIDAPGSVDAEVRLDQIDNSFAARYREHLVGIVGVGSLTGLHVILDCANGAGGAVAADVFLAAGASVEVLNNSPDGRNINDQCGSTHPEALQTTVVERGAQVGFAFDGDADRCFGVDEQGVVIDGDELMVALAVDMKRRNRLRGNSIVVTVLSNLGLRLALGDAGIAVVETAVGDRAVMAAIEQGGFAIGGEQSGHIILRDHATTGDGLLTALLFSDVMMRTSRSASSLKGSMARLPQAMINIRVPAGVKPAAIVGLSAMVETVANDLGAQGRVLVRPSGTEPLIRVMVEAQSQSTAQSAAEQIAALIRSGSA